MKICCIPVLLLVLLSQPLLAQDDLEDVLGGFDDESSADVDQSSAERRAVPMEKTEPNNLTGSAVFSSSYNYQDHQSTSQTDYRGFSKLRTQLNLQYDRDLSAKWEARIAGYIFYDWIYRNRGNQDYTDEVLDEYEWEAELKEVWLRGKLLDDVDVKIGRQVVNWGRSESLRVLDQLNPLDNREIGLGDIENLRLPVFMGKLDYYFYKWDLSLIAIPETKFSKNPVYGSDFYTYSFEISEDEPTDIEDTSWALGLTGIFSGWDVSFHAARLWADTPYVALESGSLVLEHSRINLFGTGGNYSMGNWLFKGELGLLEDVDYTTTSAIGLPTGTVLKNRVDVLLGVDYTIADTVLTLEVVSRRIANYGEQDLLNTKKNMMESSLRYNGRFINDRLNITALAVVFGDSAQNGVIYRLSSDYELRQSLNLTTGVLIFRKGEIVPYDGIGENDRVFLDIKWSF